MSSTPKINKIEINHAYYIKDNNRIKHTQYSYEGVDNGAIENSETFYPYSTTSNADLFISSDYFLSNFDEGEGQLGCRAVLCRPYTMDYTSLGVKNFGQTISFVGNDMLYGIFYTTCEYDDSLSNKIRKTKRAILVHSMQGPDPYYGQSGNLIHNSFQWNYTNDQACPIKYNDPTHPSMNPSSGPISLLPTKRVHFETRHPKDSSTYHIYQSTYIDTTNYVFHEPQSEKKTGYYPYELDYIPIYVTAMPDYNIVIPDNLNLDSNFPYYTYSEYQTTAMLPCYNKHLIHNVKRKRVGNFSYLCSDQRSHLTNHDPSSPIPIYNLEIDARLLPTYAAYLQSPGSNTGKVALSSETTAKYGMDVCAFLSHYSSFKRSGLSIWPARIEYTEADWCDCLLPTVDINNASEFVSYQGSTFDLYAPIDVDKCEEIINIVKNIVSTAINEVYITTLDIGCEYSGVPGVSSVKGPPEFTTKKDLSTFRNETEGDLQRYI